jgi:hypothetical protein
VLKIFSIYFSHLFFSSIIMEESQIKKAYLELKDEVNKNPESLKVRQ